MNPSVSTGDQARDALKDKKRDVAGKSKAAPLKPIELKQQPLSALPLKQAPSESSEGFVADAGDGFDKTKGLASLLAILVLMGTSMQMIEARACSARMLTKNLAWVIHHFGLRESTSWAFTTAGDIEGCNAAPSDLSPGFLPKNTADPASSIMSDQLQTARSLDIPCDI